MRLRRPIQLHPVLVVFALLLGERTMGLWGALLARPTLGVLQASFNHFSIESVNTPELIATRSPNDQPEG